jgi:hypothetical protein
VASCRPQGAAGTAPPRPAGTSRRWCRRSPRTASRNRATWLRSQTATAGRIPVWRRTFSRRSSHTTACGRAPFGSRSRHARSACGCGARGRGGCRADRARAAIGPRVAEARRRRRVPARLLHARPGRSRAIGPGPPDRSRGGSGSAGMVGCNVRLSGLLPGAVPSCTSRGA